MPKKTAVREDASLNVRIIDALRARTKELTVNDLAELLPFSKFAIYGWVKENKIPHMRIVGKIMFDPKKTAEWLAERCA